MTFQIDDQELLKEEFGWQNGKRFRYEYAEIVAAGRRTSSRSRWSP